MKITSGPNIHFYAITTIVVLMSLFNWSWWPISAWLVFCIVAIPLSFLIAKWDAKRYAKHCKYMLEHYGYDPDVQSNMGKASMGKNRHCK